MSDARTIESAPKDGTEILIWREDSGWLLSRWIAPCDFLHERELENMKDADEPDWFYSDFVCGGRLDGGDPTHWMPLPDAVGKHSPTEVEKKAVLDAVFTPLDVASENRELRIMLAIAHAGLSLYTDDGELQDNRVLPFIDFKRDSVAEIERKLRERAYASAKDKL